ncbi:uncharacterized protein LOC112679867 isoform X2 [Sipha flava]|uniref:Uncharacterized protein LOC112679867 isoform X2 n=1 Tax=Sipha flava TaxID=143950 RepID=A0A8B8F470_9HEMI|nr:uncharacterized protein LOC112679867 isoform X2 [Sipha flava]
MIFAATTTLISIKGETYNPDNAIRTLSDSDNDESVETECVSSKLNEENGKNTNVTIQKPKDVVTTDIIAILIAIKILNVNVVAAVVNIVDSVLKNRLVVITVAEVVVIVIVAKDIAVVCFHFTLEWD